MLKNSGAADQGRKPQFKRQWNSKRDWKKDKLTFKRNHLITVRL
jgi:hypothetical protein